MARSTDAPAFIPIGVFGRAADDGPALIAAPAPVVADLSPSPRTVPSRPVVDERPGVIEVDLVDGTRLRVDSFVNERALRRVLTVLKAAS
jgi:transposase